MKRLLLLLAIAMVGAGIAFGASTVLFSPSSNDDEVEPEGLITEISTDEPKSTDRPSPSPEPTATADPSLARGTGTAASSGSGTAPAADASEPRRPSSGTTSTTVQNGVVTEGGLHDDDPCADEDNEAEREACEDELDTEEDEEEEEREEEEEEEEEEDE